MTLFYHIRPKDNSVVIMGIKKGEYFEIGKEQTDDPYFYSLLFKTPEAAQEYINEHLNPNKYIPEWIYINSNFVCPDCGDILYTRRADYYPNTTGYPPKSRVFICSCRSCDNDYEIIEDENYKLVKKQRYYFG